MSFLGAIESGFSALGDRIRNPFVGSFVLSWAAFNWHSLYTTFFLSEEHLPSGYTDKLTYITQGIEHTWQTLLWYPAGAALVLTFLLPLLGGGSKLGVNAITDLFNAWDAKRQPKRYYELGKFEKLEKRIQQLEESLTRAEADRDRYESNYRTARDQSATAAQELEETKHELKQSRDGATNLKEHIDEATAKLESVEQEHKQAVKALKAEHQESTESLKAEHQHALESLQTKLEAQVDEIAKAKEDSEAELRGRLEEARKAFDDAPVNESKQGGRDLKRKSLSDVRALGQEASSGPTLKRDEQVRLDVEGAAHELFAKRDDILRHHWGREAVTSETPFMVIFPGKWEKRWPSRKTIDAQDLSQKERARFSNEGMYQIEKGPNWQLVGLAFNHDDSISFEQRSGFGPTRFSCLFALAPNHYVGVEGYQHLDVSEPTLYQVEYVRHGELLPEQTTPQTLPLREWYTGEGLFEAFGHGSWVLVEDGESPTENQPLLTVRDEKTIEIEARPYNLDGTRMVEPNRLELNLSAGQTVITLALGKRPDGGFDAVLLSNAGIKVLEQHFNLVRL